MLGPAHQHDSRTGLSPPDELSHTDFEMVVRRLADDLAHGTDASLFVGSGLEYAQSRPYQVGDPVRQLDARVSARTGIPHVKEYETLKRTGIFFVVDTSASMGVASTRLTKHDLAVWITAAVGLVGQRRLSPVAIVGGGERETRLNPSLARSDLFQALEPLRTTATDGEATRIGERVDLLRQRVRRRSLFIIISDLHDPQALEAIRRAAQQHDTIVLHLQDPAERGKLHAGFYRGREAETGATFVGSDRTAWTAGYSRDELVRSGASYLDLMTNRPFIAPLRHFLVARSRVGGGRG